MTTYDRLQFEAQQDERRTLESQGLVVPNPDGTPRTVVRSRPVRSEDRLTTLYTARCSCGFTGNEYGSAAYRLALDERNAHRCSTPQALEILRQNGSL